jgi:iron complex outermembrane receptor protein
MGARHTAQRVGGKGFPPYVRSGFAFPFSRVHVFTLLVAALLAPPALAEDLADLPLEALMRMEVEGASRFPQKFSEAPAAATILTREDIRRHGWRTLAEALAAVRGVYVTRDRVYSYLGVRGLSTPGDYNGRVLLLVDGHRVNDTIYDQAFIGNELGLDLAWVERIEFVPGPGSVVYGGNALLGVINVTTRTGLDMGGGQAYVEAGDFDAWRTGASYGRVLDNGADLFMGVSHMDAQGQALDYPGQGSLPRGADAETASAALLKLTWGDMRFEAGFSDRDKQVPGAPFGADFGDARFAIEDRSSHLDWQWRPVLSEDTVALARLYYGDYVYEGDYPIAGTLNRDLGHGRWWGGEARVDTRLTDTQRLVACVEYQHDDQLQRNHDVDPFAQYLDDRRKGERIGIYAQDELRLGDFILDLGARYDHHDGFGGIVNPRVALIRPWPSGHTLKAIVGSSYRPPNAYELYYQDGATQIANPNLDPERIQAVELVWEYQRGDWLASASLFHNHFTDRIALADIGGGLLSYRNTGAACAEGVELEATHHLGKLQLSGNYSYTSARDDTGAWLVNSPKHLAKARASLPLFDTRATLALDAQAMSERKTRMGSAGGFGVVNLNFIWRFSRDLELSATATNLFDKHYADPSSEEFVPDSIAQDGRALRLRLTAGF